jgi:opacity protein-like surface antigen
MVRYLLLLITAFTCIPALAQAPVVIPPESEKWEFSIFAGSSHRGGDVFATPGEGTGARNVGLDFASGYMVGARITENLGQRLGAELDYTLANQPLQFTDLAPGLPSLGLSHRVHGITYTILVYGTGRRSGLRPYAAVGPGVALYETYGDSENRAIAQGLTLKDRWKFGMSLGGGVKYHLRREFGFRADIKDFITGVPDLGLPQTATPTSPGFRSDGRLHNWQLSIGFFYGFQGR